MKPSHAEPSGRNGLRARALSLLKGPDAHTHVLANTTQSLRVLYELASTPATAPNALALLHELQVHQVEVDLQDEELRRSRVELEAMINSQVPLYDFAPVGLLSVDINAVLRELNRMGATQLGLPRDLLIGRSLADFAMSDDVPTLRAMLGRVTDGAVSASANLRLRALPGGEIRLMHACACVSPAGGGFLIAMMESPAVPAA
jgi:PAS domain-containing protein